MAQTILVVDDDPHIREVVCFALRKAGFVCHEAVNGEAALAAYAGIQPELVILDIMMPELDGTEVCKHIRRQAPTPIIFLSARDDEIDRILGLELGGDDYLGKPFSPRELVARVKAVLRRGQGNSAPGEAELRYGQLRLIPDEYRAFWTDKELILTATEFGILRTLLSRPGKVFSRDDIMNGAYNVHRIVSDRTIDSHVRRLRQKFEALGGCPVQTVHGVGYKLARPGSD